MERRDWIRVTTHEKCAICGKATFCTRSADGVIAKCMRVESQRPASGTLGGWIHRLTDPLPKIDLRALPEKEKPVINWTTLAQTMFESPTAAEERHYLAKTLGVSEAALVELWVGRGWDDYRHIPYSSWPERDASGKVVGIVRRYRDGAKKTMRHSSHGIYFAAPLMRMRLGPVFCVEGGSDTAALLTLGVNVVGRPSNLGGVDELVAMARSISRYTQWVVVGERDEKPDGMWPGKQGAVTTAQRMSDQLQRRVKWIMPPAKDVRAWLNEVGTITGPEFLKAVREW